MRPHPKIRKTVKWGGLLLVVALLATLLTSKWLAIEYHSARGGRYGFGAGALNVAHPWSALKGFGSGGWTTRRMDMRIRWDARLSYSSAGIAAGIPLWVPTVIAAAIAVLAWRRDSLARGERANLCPTCHYSLTGLAPGSPCPECGKAARGALNVGEVYDEKDTCDDR